MVALKIKAHQRVDEARAAGVLYLHWMANQAADALAEQAAMAAQLPSEAIATVIRLDDESLRVQQHLTAVSMAVARRAPQLYGPSTRFIR